MRWDSGGRRVLRLGKASVALPRLSGYIQLVIVGLALAGVAYLALGMAPGATLTIVPPSTTLSGTAVIIGDEAQDDVDLDTLRLPAREITRTERVTITVPATGTSQAGTSTATVRLTITNASEEPVTLPSRTLILGPGGVQFALNTATNVPASDSTTVEAAAVLPGPAGNVPAGSLIRWERTDLTALAVTNQAAATGGAEQEVKVVSEADIAAITALAETLKTSPAIAGLVLEGHGHEAVFANTVSAEVSYGEPYPSVGATTDLVLLIVDVSLTALAVPEDALEEVARSIFAPTNGGAELVPGSVVAVQTGGRTNVLIDDAIESEFLFTADFVDEVSRDELRSAVKGKSEEDARSILRERYGIQEPGVSLTPGWAPWLPRFAFRIDVNWKAASEAVAAAEETPEPPDDAATPTAEPTSTASATATAAGP